MKSIVILVVLSLSNLAQSGYASQRPILWLKADSLSLSSGQAVREWKDESEFKNTFSQTILEQGPTFHPAAIHGHAAVHFDRNQSQFLETTRFQPARVNQITVFIVAAPRSNFGQYDCFLSGGAKNSPDYSSGLVVDQGDQSSTDFSRLNVEGSKGQGSSNIMVDHHPFGSFHLITLDYGNAIMPLVYVDRVPQLPKFNGQTESALELRDFRIGARRYEGSSGFFDGDIAEILIFPGRLTYEERNTVEDELSVKYGLAGANQTQPTIVFKNLLVIKKDVRLNTVQASFSDRQIALLTRSFQEYVPAWVNWLSHGQVTWETAVVVSDIPLTKARWWEDQPKIWVAPEDVSDDLQRFAAAGKYDGVFFAFNLLDHAANLAETGGGFSSVTGFAGYTSIYPIDEVSWAIDGDYGTEAVIHEWLHQLEQFYGERGVNLPDGGLHGNVAYAYGQKDPAFFHKPWYERFLNGTVWDGSRGYLGLGPNAWRLGGVRRNGRPL